ncbi:unnamed protein product [Paramecium octaurelia]|uniref:Uncharacterized protein n=1 Tax=Paramecium octaurelia TaxID=43137 RepID=A0A8S1YBZ4_PAROT|nr:unnamed protein product [Paramecium octaurelia]
MIRMEQRQTLTANNATSDFLKKGIIVLFIIQLIILACQYTAGTENCFLCDKENECRSCFSTHYLAPGKKCELIIEESNPICQTCYVTQPDYCTTCFTQQMRSSRIVPGQCVCDQTLGYAELDGECILCSTGFCLTCTLIFGECTSCDPLQYRNLIDSKCPCKQGYWIRQQNLLMQFSQIFKLECYFSCYNFSGPFENNCTDCGDPNIYHKELVDGKYIYCHPRCEKCQSPEDNSSNQYCSMCIAEQNRTVSSDLKCVCKKGYGEVGIVDICFKCDYTCLSCNGLLLTNCTVCSSETNRHLTAENKCLCNSGYYDTGRNDILCQRIIKNMFDYIILLDILFTGDAEACGAVWHLFFQLQVYLRSTVNFILPRQ